MSFDKGGQVRQATTDEINAARAMAREVTSRHGYTPSGPGYGQEWYPAGQGPHREDVQDRPGMAAPQAKPL